jgi:pimeloyl-ACP methyl ester carboxylesterase
MAIELCQSSPDRVHWLESQPRRRKTPSGRPPDAARRASPHLIPNGLARGNAMSSPPHAVRVAHLQLPRGPRLEYAEQGPADGSATATVLMLHGITDSWRSFEPVLPHLPRDCRVVSLTQRGHGGSSAPPQAEFGARAFAADAASFIAILGLAHPAPVVVVGHSMGATNALRLAIDRPELVHAVVAAGAFASFADKPGLAQWVASDIATLGDEVPRALAEAFQRDTVAGPTAPGLIETMVDECLRTPAAVWRGAFAGLLAEEIEPELARIAAPVLLPWGDADAFALEDDQQRLVRALPQARRSVYRGAGHALHWEAPERFVRELAAFVAALPAPPRQPPGPISPPRTTLATLN